MSPRGRAAGERKEREPLTVFCFLGFTRLGGRLTSIRESRADSEDWLSESSRSTIDVGLLDGFTTFSTFFVQAFLDFEAGEPANGLLYVAASVGLGIGAAAVGYFGARAAFH